MLYIENKIMKKRVINGCTLYMKYILMLYVKDKKSHYIIISISVNISTFHCIYYFYIKYI